MRRPRPFILASFVLTMLAIPAFGQQTAPTSEFAAKLKALPGVVEVRPGAGRGGRGGTTETYTVLFEQPVDHQNPAGAGGGGGKFQQRAFVSFAGYDKPVLLGTEGYAANGLGGGELQQMLAGNQVTVEHRYFGQSVPSPLEWKYLTVKNAADDMHAIVTTLKKVYTGKWVATGASKGGQTALFYKCYYPDDMDATVAYVAPINVQQEDPRINHFMETVGDEATRKKIKDYQIALFKREDEILPLIKARAEQQRWTFGMGLSQAYEYGVLEYPYAFWQYGTRPSTIPAPDAPAQAMADHYNQVGMLRFYSDQGKKPLEPFMYQAFTEIGYYNYDITDFKSVMKTLKNPTNLDLCPEGTQDKIVYNPAAMTFVYSFLQYKANNVAYIYGETDAWSATQMQLIGRTNAIKVVVQNAAHNARITAASAEQKEMFYSNLDQWLGMKVNRQ